MPYTIEHNGQTFTYTGVAWGNGFRYQACRAESGEYLIIDALNKCEVTAQGHIWENVMDDHVDTITTQARNLRNA